jgi:hypothetical protein
VTPLAWLGSQPKIAVNSQRLGAVLTSP